MDIFDATRNGYTDIVELLLDSGIDPNTENERGYTSLMYASSDGYTDIVLASTRHDPYYQGAVIQFFLNNGDGSFSDVTTDFNPSYSKYEEGPKIIKDAFESVSESLGLSGEEESE